ncbi:hypothetical protein [Methylocystis heyeri]|uniref:PH domain-containing protein n=1 Tax=Methylocystis heyeri TaxID=391905 RepID=A0A6B8KBV0_9HYPH|nr:hypothetical protein [Methylocystis heyeri]QGM45874.1 hypothetical protein H2LOC_009260 [Methylocystis heyeri]
MTDSGKQSDAMTVSRPNFWMTFLALAIALGIAFAFYDRAGDKHVWLFGLVLLFFLLMPARFVEIDAGAREFVFRRRFVFDALFGRFERRETLPFAEIDGLAPDYDSESGHVLRIVLKSGESRRVEGVSPARIEEIKGIVFSHPPRG